MNRILSQEVNSTAMPNLQFRQTLQFRSELHRLLSFPLYQPGVAKKQLAKHGFFLRDNGTTIQCYFCNKTGGDYLLFNESNVLNALLIHNENCPMVDLDRVNNNVSLCNTGNYRYEACRLLTFMDVNWRAPVSPYDLARDGFYWTQSEDNCMCTFCHLEISEWEVGDTVRGEHERWNQACQFIRGDRCGNVKIGDEFDPSFNALSNPLTGVQKFKAFEKNIKYLQSDAKHLRFEELGISILSPAKYAQYKHTATREETYKFWPMVLSQRPKELSLAGYFYTGVGDRVICHHCGGGLKDWAYGDDPWTEHAKWFPTCSYLLVKKGKSFVDYSNGLIGDNLSNNSKTSNNTKDVCQGTSNAQGSNTKSMICPCCKERDVDAVNLPCGDMEYCYQCRSTILEENCKKCGQPVKAFIQAFIA